MSILEFFINITDKDYVLNVLKDYQKAHNNVPFKDFFYARYLKDNGRLN